MKEIFGTIEELLDLVHKIEGKCLFRGHSSADFALRPSIGRPHPKFVSSPDVERALFLRFKLLAQSQFPSPPEGDLDWLILARHYGLRTRLLDWTRSLYVALYFSLAERGTINSVPFSIIIVTDPLVESYFDLKNKNPFEIGRTVFFEPPHIDARISNQEAFLSIHHEPFKDFEAKHLLQFNLIPTVPHIEHIENMLVEFGIRHSRIYPGPDGIARHLNENPNELDVELNFVTPSPWKRVPTWTIGKTVGEIERALIKDRSFAYLLRFNILDPSNIIGLPVELDGKPYGRFRSLNREEEYFVILANDGVEKVHWATNSKEAEKLKIPTEQLKNLFPKGLKFRRKATDLHD